MISTDDYYYTTTSTTNTASTSNSVWRWADDTDSTTCSTYVETTISFADPIYVDVCNCKEEKEEQKLHFRIVMNAWSACICKDLSQHYKAKVHQGFMKPTLNRRYSKAEYSGKNFKKQ